MLIDVKPRSYFEKCRGKYEKSIFRVHRVISINAPGEPPPFSGDFGDRLLVLHFADVDEGQPGAMTEEHAQAILDFISANQFDPIIVHCGAGISRSGAVGQVLNWYYNRYREDNPAAYRHFEVLNPGIVPNAHVRRLLLAAIKRDEQRQQELIEQLKKLCEERNLLADLRAVEAEKLLLPRIQKWLDKFDCLRFTEKLTVGTPEMLREIEAKFLREGCGITHYNNWILVTDFGAGKLREVWAQALRFIQVEKYDFKGEDQAEFFAPFAARFKSAAWDNPDPLKLLLNDPQRAAIDLLAQRQWQRASIRKKVAISAGARRFNARVAAADAER